MNYKYIRKIQKRIRKCKAELAKVNDEINNYTQVLSDMPKGGSISNKVEDCVIRRQDLMKEIENLEIKLRALIKGIPNTEQGNAIRMKLKGWSWRRIATDIEDNPNLWDSIRKRCERYTW